MAPLAVGTLPQSADYSLDTALSPPKPDPRLCSLKIITRHYTPEAVGSGPVLQEIAAWFVKQGHTVDVLTVRPSYPAPDIFPDYRSGRHDVEILKGVPIKRLPARRGAKGLWRRAIPELAFFLRLLLQRLKDRPHGGHMLSLCPSILTVTAALLWRPSGNHIALVHDIPSGLAKVLGTGRRKLALGALRLLETWTFNHVDGIVVLSTAMETQLRNQGVDKTPIIILPPSVDTGIIRPYPRPPNTPPTLLYSGTFGRKQGLDQLLDLAALLKTELPEARMILRGDGPLKEELVARAERQELNQITFQPIVAEEDFAAAMAEGDLHLIPQLSSGADYAVPSKTYAIMAAGRPFIATAEPGSPLWTLAKASGGGLCVQPGAIDDLARLVIDLLGNPRLRVAMGRAGRIYATRMADTGTVMRRLRGFMEAPR